MATANDVLAQLAKLAGEDEARMGQNNTTVNKYFNAPGQPYCGYSVWYAVKMAGSTILNGCDNPAYVPTIKAFMEAKGWRVENFQAQAGDIFVYQNDHVGFVYEKVSASTVITLEGNSRGLRATAWEAKSGSGATYEGIGYRKLVLTTGYTVYRPPYTGQTSNPASGSTSSAAAAAINVGAAQTVTLNVLKQGHRGPQVKTVQRILAAADIKGGDGKSITIDGEFGANTRAAVITLQKRLFPGISSEWDGEVGAKTWTGMLTELA